MESLDNKEKNKLKNIIKAKIGWEESSMLRLFSNFQPNSEARNCI